MNKTQIDGLGDRLRVGHITERDLRALNEYRLAFAPAYSHVIGVIRATLGIEPSGRPAKSTRSIVEKLQRETIRLTQIQDIAGVRFVVADIEHQDREIRLLVDALDKPRIVDRREQPSHGYRAVHIVPVADGMPVEIQVRTTLQHNWAELSEKLSDALDPNLKYGGGDPELQAALVQASRLIFASECGQEELKPLVSRIARAVKENATPAEQLKAVLQAKPELDELRQRMDDGNATLQVVWKVVFSRIQALSERV